SLDYEVDFMVTLDKNYKVTNKISKRLETRRMANEKNNKPQSRGALFSSLAALGGVIVASSCCLPILPFVVASGLAGVSAIFVTLRPYFLVGSVLLVALGFYQSWRAKKCARKVSRWSRVVLWFSAAVT